MSPQTTCLRQCRTILVAFIWLFSTVCFQMCSQMACRLRGSIVTLIAFIWLFATMFSQMNPQITSTRRYLVTLIAFLWHNDIVSLFLNNSHMCILQTQVKIFKSLFHYDCVDYVLLRLWLLSTEENLWFQDCFPPILIALTFLGILSFPMGRKGKITLPNPITFPEDPLSLFYNWVTNVQNLMSRCPNFMSRCPYFYEQMSGSRWADVPKKWWADVWWASVLRPMKRLLVAIQAKAFQFSILLWPVRKQINLVEYFEKALGRHSGERLSNFISFVTCVETNTFCRVFWKHIWLTFRGRPFNFLSFYLFEKR